MCTAMQAHNGNVRRQSMRLANFQFYFQRKSTKRRQVKRRENERKVAFAVHCAEVAEEEAKVVRSFFPSSVFFALLSAGKTFPL